MGDVFWVVCFSAESLRWEEGGVGFQQEVCFFGCEEAFSGLFGVGVGDDVGEAESYLREEFFRFLDFFWSVASAVEVDFQVCEVFQYFDSFFKGVSGVDN